MALLELCQYVVGDGLACGYPVFNGEAVDDLKGHLALCHLVLEQMLQDPLGLGSDNRADAVAAADADDNCVEGGVVGELLHGLDTLVAL